MRNNSKSLIALSLSSVLLIFPLINREAVQAKPINDREVLISIGNKSELLREGRFETINERTSGNVRLIRADNGRLYIELGSNFRTQPDSDLFVVLSRSTDLKNESQTDERFYMVSPVLRLEGRQSFILPGDFNPDEYASVAIWSRKNNSLFGAATLK